MSAGDRERAQARAVEDVVASQEVLKHAREDFRQALIDAKKAGVTRRRLAELTGYSGDHIYRIAMGRR